MHSGKPKNNETLSKDYTILTISNGNNNLRESLQFSTLHKKFSE